jgi:hypothetical protein
MTTKEYYTALKSEIQTDPETLGYSGQTDQWVTDKLNEVGGSGETKSQTEELDMTSIMGEFVLAELESLTTNQAILLSGMLSRSGISPVNGAPLIGAIFGDGTTTRSNLLALANTSISRAEALGFPTVELHHVENALHTTWWDI